jgi:hypothetical protein
VSDSPSIQSEKPFWPRFAKALALLLIALLTLCGGWKIFRHAKLKLALRNAHREFSAGQFMRAEFWTGRAFAVNGQCVEATRLMADIDEAENKPAALGWRIKVAQLEPGNTADLMAWAGTALRFDQMEMVATALRSPPRDFKNQSPEYQELMGSCALAGREMGLAEAYFITAANLDHDNPVYRATLAGFRLAHSSRREIREAAARDLEQMLTDPRVSLFAARALLADAIQDKDNAREQHFAQKLGSLPGHDFNDDLSCLEATLSEHDFHSNLDEVEDRAAPDALWTLETGDWLNAHGMAAETLRWFARLPPATQSNIRVQMTAAGAYLSTYDWGGLRAFLAKCNWGACEFLRGAMLIRCDREQSRPWEKEWNQLVTGAEANSPNDFLLAQLVIGWKWRQEAVDLLWEASTKPQTDSRALQSLWDLYSETSDTAELLRVATAQLALDPSNPTRKNNYAFLSLLLIGASAHSESLAQEASAANPRVPEWAATYAYSLHLTGKDSEAKRVMGNLPAEALSRPGIALYYAIVLAANGDYPHARQSLENLNPNGMLPEEQKLASDLAQKLSLASR